MVQLLELNRSNYSEPLIELYWTSQIGVYRKKYHSSKYFDLYRSQLRSEHSDRVVQSTDRTVLNTPIEWLYWALRSSSCTVLNTSDPNIKHSNQQIELYRTISNWSEASDRVHCTEHSDRVAVPYWTLRIQILSTPIEQLQNTSIEPLICTLRTAQTDLYRTLQSFELIWTAENHFDRTTGLLHFEQL